MPFIPNNKIMKSILITSCLAFMGFTLYGQSWISSTQITGTEDINVIKSISDVDDNTIVLGEYLGTISQGTGTTLPSYGLRDYFLIKLNSEGTVDWATNIGGTGNEFAYGGVGTDQNGNIFVSGGFRNNVFFSSTDSIEGTGLHDIFLAKYDPTGTLSWYKNVGAGAKAQRPSTLTVDINGNILLAGTFADSIKIDDATTLYSDNAIADYFYCQFDNDGNLDWVKQIKASNNPLSGAIFNITAGADFITMTGVYSDTILIEDQILVSDTLFDVHLIKTNLQGDLQWIRRISGEGYVYSYNIAFDPDDNVYVTGYYDSPSLVIDSTGSEQITIDSNVGGIDFFVAKFNSGGTFQWIRTNGGISNDKLYDIEYYDQEITVCGYFTDSISWGGIHLMAEGSANDRDMFTGTLDMDGNYRSANRFGGRNNSIEEAYSISLTSDKLYNVIRSNSDLLHLGEDTYFSVTGKFYLVFGVVGCLPISVDNAIPTNVNTCYGDSTGSIQISASGGFGAPWQYSIDNGKTYQKDLTLFPNLPAGNYQVVVLDAEQCAKAGPLVTVGQPAKLMVEIVDMANIIKDYYHAPDQDGLIVVAASGGTPGYSYTLLPGGQSQSLGTFTFTDSIEAGLYQVSVSDRNECGPAVTDTIIIEYLTPVSEETLMSLRVYPNPSSSLINVELQLDAAEVNLEVVSLTGQVVMRKQTFTSGGELREAIDVSDLARGMYMLRVNGETLKSAIVVH